MFGSCGSGRRGLHRGDEPLARFDRWNAGRNSHFDQRTTELVVIAYLIFQQAGHLGQLADQIACAVVVAGLAVSDQHAERAGEAMGIGIRGGPSDWPKAYPKD